MLDKCGSDKRASLQHDSINYKSKTLWKLPLSEEWTKVSQIISLCVQILFGFGCGFHSHIVPLKQV